MAVMDPKIRTVSCRLAKSEYALAEQASRERNCQSLSVFVRRAILAYCRNSSPALDDEELREMRGRLETLEEQVREFSTWHRDTAAAPSGEAESF